MTNPIICIVFAASLFAGGFGTAAAQQLSIQEAETIAIQRDDPSIARFRNRAAALSEKAIADSQLPDPNLKAGLLNLPVDTFSFGQEPMTQALVGLQQQFPPGRTRRFLGERRQSEAAAEGAKALLREQEIRRDVRSRWLELYYWLAAKRKVGENRDAIDELAKVARATFAAGQQRSQDVLRAELELSLLEDRLVQIDRETETARAKLARLIGSAAARPLPTTLPVLPSPPAAPVLRQLLKRHPSIQVENAQIEVTERDVDLALQQYKPKFSLDLDYGAREDRPDFLSARVNMSLPVFTGKRQDKNLEAAHGQRSAALLDRDARLLELDEMLQVTLADWHRLEQRIALYDRSVLRQADETTQAALSSYRTGVTDFPELIRARLALLDNELRRLRLLVDRAQAQARLLFLAGR